MFQKVTVHLSTKSVSRVIRHCFSITQLSYESYGEHEFQPKTKLFNELVDIASSSYQHPYDTIRTAVHQSNRLYVLRQAAQNSPMLCCTLIEYGKKVTLSDRDQKIPVIYHSFMIVNEKLKNTGLTMKLLEYFSYKMQQQKQKQPQIPLLVYYVTATPSVIYQTDRFIKMVPSINDYNRKEYTDEQWHIVNQLRKLRNWPTVIKSSNVNPFVVKGIMKSRYSTCEQMRIDKIVTKANYKIFQDLGIDEINGDRLLRYAII